MTRDDLSQLRTLKAGGLLRYFDELSQEKRVALVSQIRAIDPRQMNALWGKVTSGPYLERPLSPLSEFSRSGSQKRREAGLALVEKGLVGCLLIAGGQGTRLGFSGPKGCFPISVVHRKSLFQLFAEKVVAASRQAGVLLPVAIMTSRDNDRGTIQHFEENRYFGLSRDQVTFFCQRSLPLLNDKGQLFLARRDLVADGPTGNGELLAHFYESGLWERWSAAGVKYLQTCLIDNPLGGAFDAELAGMCMQSRADVVIKATTRLSEEEMVGSVVVADGSLAVVEYMELSQEERAARRADGLLRHSVANLSLFGMTMEFARHAALRVDEMPIHVARKRVHALNGEGFSAPIEGYKFERFIFDILPFAEKVEALVYPREECFAPLKSAEGPASPESVQGALQARDRQVYRQVTGRAPPSEPFELSQDYYYPTPEFLAQWR